jgi:hypothetical protein
MEAVFVFGDLAAAGGGAAVYVKIHTGGFPLFQDAALPQRENFVDEFQHGIHRAHIGEGAEVAGAVFNNMPGPENTGEGLGGDTDHRIGFAVLEVDVVLGSMLLDQGVFQEQGLVLVGHHDGLNAPGMAYQGSGFDVLFAGKIGIQTVTEYAGLTYIDDAPILIPHDINTAFQGRVMGRGFEGGKIFRKF